MFGGLGDLAGLMKQAKSMQENMKKVQETLAQQRFEAEAGAGMVRTVVNGKGDLVDIKIDSKATEDIELLEDMKMRIRISSPEVMIELLTPRQTVIKIRNPTEKILIKFAATVISCLR